MYISQLMLEVTRRCNFECGHCMRGDSEDKDMPEKVVDKILEPIKDIGCLSFTGGEPFLNLSLLEYTLNKIKEEGITVDYFYIATNGTQVNVNVLKFICDLYSYCDSKEECSIRLSNSQFHDWFTEDTDADNINMLNLLKLVYEDDGEIKDERMLNRGKAFHNGLAGKNLHSAKSEKAIIPENLTKEYIQNSGNLIYISVAGDVFIDCDLSYYMMDEDVCEEGAIHGEIKPVKLCTVDNFKEVWEGLPDD